MSTNEGKTNVVEEGPRPDGVFSLPALSSANMEELDDYAKAYVAAWEKPKGQAEVVQLIEGLAKYSLYEVLLIGQKVGLVIHQETARQLIEDWLDEDDE